MNTYVSFCLPCFSTRLVLGSGWGLYSHPLNPGLHLTEASWQSSKGAIITSIPQSRKGSITERKSPLHWYLANKRENRDLNPSLDAFFHMTSSQSFCKLDSLTISTRRSSQFCGQPFSFSDSFQEELRFESLGNP